MSHGGLEMATNIPAQLAEVIEAVIAVSESTRRDRWVPDAPRDGSVVHQIPLAVTPDRRVLFYSPLPARGERGRGEGCSAMISTSAL